ncbi:MAG: hypothetical protein HPY69_10355 [Armatimonadetes bacterium]|nr:hypothetical protein [Armatimonadota bacterium]
MEDKDLTQLVREFVETLLLYLRQQGRDLVTEVTTRPLRRAGAYVLLLAAVSSMLTLGIALVGIGAALGLRELTGSSAAGFGLMGLVMLLAAFVTYRLGTPRSRRKEEESGPAES